MCVCVCVSGLALTRVCLSLGHRWKMEDGPREVAFLLHFTCCSSVSVCPPVGLLHEAVSGAPAISIIDVAGKSRQHVAETVAVTVAETFILTLHTATGGATIVTTIATTIVTTNEEPLVTTIEEPLVCGLDLGCG